MRRRYAHVTAALALAAALAAPAAAKQIQPFIDPIMLKTMSSRVCGTPDLSQAEQDAVEARLGLSRKTLGQLAVGGQIKVYWHVIYSNSGEGNIPQSQIDAQIAELNKAYSGFYGGVNTGYTFVLAGVSRTQSRKWFTMSPNTDGAPKQALAVDPAHRFNVYSCKPGQNLLGWAVFPSSYPESNYHHGVVIHYGSVPGGYLAPYNLGGTLDHEAGHYLGLYHTFQGGCTGSGDFCADTPAEATPTSGCPGNKDTCAGGGLDPIHNYMDYSDDACYTQFTANQDARMDQQVPTYRPSLLNAAAVRVVTDREIAPAVPLAVSFRGAVPNPFRGETSLIFSLASRERVTLNLYNVAGQNIRTLVDGEMGAGEQRVTLRADDIAPGVYFAALKVGDQMITRRVMLLH